MREDNKAMDKNLKIYFTSDLHGYFFPTNYTDSAEQDMGLFKCANRFKKDGNTLIIDGGDILQGSPFANFCQSVEHSNLPIAEIMNKCGYDYITIGNHDFNYGMDYLSSYIDALDGRCVCQNLYTSFGESRFPFKIHVMENGLRVGIMGIVTSYVTMWERPENLGEFSIEDPFEAAKAALLDMKGNCDITICVYHGGFERALDTGEVLSNTAENIAWRICDELDFDILLTGHQHMSISGMTINGTFAVQPTENGREFHQIDASVDDDGNIKISSHKIPAAGACDAEIYEKYSALEARVNSWLDETVGTMEQPLLPESHIDMAAHGSGIADFLNSVQLYFTDAQVSCVSLANSVYGFNEQVTRRNVLSTYPYPNTLVVLEITGAALRAAIERSAEYFSLDGDILSVSDTFLKPKIEHYNYDYFAGVSYRLDISKPVGERVVELTRDGIAIDADETLSICVNSYRASGAGGYPMYPSCKVIKEVNFEMSDLILRYFEEHPHIAKEDMERIKGELNIEVGNTRL